MTRVTKWLALLLALCLLGAMMLNTFAEDEEIVAAPVDAAVDEIDAADLWTEDIAKDVEACEAEQAAAEAAKAAGDIPIDAEHFPNEVFRTYLTEYVDDGDGVLSQAERDAVTSLEIEYGETTHYSKIDNLAGIEYFGNLAELDCRNLALEHVDVSQNTKLTVLRLPFNAITHLDVSHNPALTALNVNKANHNDPGLTELDVSHNPKLVELGISYNDMTALDISACPMLEALYANGNTIASLDLSHNPAFTTLYCYDGALTTLNLSGCANLSYVECHKNRIKSLDLTGCASLKQLWCYDNQISSLDVSVTDCLRTLSCGSNPIAKLTLTRSLKNLYCCNIALKTLNLYGCPTLIELSQRTPSREYSSNLGGYYLHYATTSYEMNVDEDMTFVVEEPVPEPTVEPTPEPTPAPVSIKTAKVTVKDQTYTGKAIKPAPVVKLGGVKLEKGADYTVSYKNNKAVGLATVTVKGKGSYTGSVKATFKIKPKAVALSKLTAGTKKLTVQWKKVAGAGYQLQYSTKKDFSTKKTVTITKAATVKQVVKGLKSGKTYYVRIRGYKKVDGKAYVSAWSKVLKKKVK